MKGFGAVLLSLFLVSCVAAEDSDVIVLTDDTFDAEVAKYDFLLVEFYAPWCGHCKKLAPEYEKAATTLKKDENPLYLAKVDATENRGLAERFGIQGFPTMKLIRKNADPIAYNGGRSEAEIVNWMRKKTGPVTKTLNTEAELTAFTESNKLAVIGFFNDEHAELKKIFETVAGSNDELAFGVSASTEVTEKLQGKAPGVVLLKPFDELRNELFKEFTEEELRHFIGVNILPSVMEFGQSTAQKIFGGKIATLFFLAKEADSDAEKEFRAAATQLKGKVLMCVSTSADGLGKRLAQVLGVDPNELPQVRLAVPGGPSLTKYIYDKESVKSADLIDFVSRFEEGKLTPHFKSEPVPEKQDSPVMVVVGKSFKDIVMDPTKDVMIELYAPWCHHCQELAPIYEKVAEKLKDDSNVVIAKMDATANEVQGLSVRGFPTIKFYPANNKSQPVDYTSQRTEEAFLKFLEEHRTAAAVEKATEETAESNESAKKEDL